VPQTRVGLLKLTLACIYLPVKSGVRVDIKVYSSLSPIVGVSTRTHSMEPRPSYTSAPPVNFSAFSNSDIPCRIDHLSLSGQFRLSRYSKSQWQVVSTLNIDDIFKGVYKTRGIYSEVIHRLNAGSVKSVHVN
jgi:hypothetical protein